MATRRITSYLTDQRGAVAATYALALFGLVVIGGVGFDYGRMMAMDSELQNGADEAALAGATQLDGKANACSRAAAAAIGLVTNKTLLAQSGQTISIANEADCDATGSVRFWQDKAHSVAADADANARFIELNVDVRTVRFAFTPLTGLLVKSLSAGAMAGLGSSICKVPPIMICSPDPLHSFDAASKEGFGIVATGHETGNSSNKGGNAGTDSNNTWAPGDFGFLQVNDPSTNGARNAQLMKALAYGNPPIDCVSTDGNKVSTGNPQGLYDAINTRFDIYDFNDNGVGNVLAPCQGGSCPSAPNVIKDMVNKDPSKSCKIVTGNNPGWQLPSAGKEFKPVTVAGSTNSTEFDDNNKIDVMGLPRDNCHYTSYNGTGICPNGRFGNGVWARADYFKTNHKVGATIEYPPDWTNITRYKTYLWELDNSKVTNGTTATSQRGLPVCFSGSPAGGRERRVMTVAVVKNCADLHGTSETVQVDEWVDVFLVEPSVDAAVRYNNYKDAIYMEVIGPSKLAGGGGIAAQLIRRDVPYLVH